MKKFTLPLIIFLTSAAVALYNIGNFPKMLGDEGIYVAQGWWLAHFGQLGPYTYWYDHFPLGWTQIGLWELIVGPLRFFNHSVLSTRIFIGLILSGSSVWLYLLGKEISKSKIVGTLTSIIFITSSLTLTFGRMVLLDNIAVFWLLLSLFLLVHKPTKLKFLTFSALTLCLAILSKESLLFFLPPYLFTVYYFNRLNPHLKYALFINYTTIFFLLSFFPLFSLLKGELFPAPNQVSFLGTLLFQAHRGTGLAFWLAKSDFRQMLDIWLKIDTILILLGGLSTIILLLLRLPFALKISSLFTLSFIFFLIRGGQLYDFYLIPIIPLLSLNISLLIAYFSDITKNKFLPIIFALGLIGVFFFNGLYPLTTTATATQITAIDQLKSLPINDFIIANNYAYLDLILAGHPNIFWYTKIESDPDIHQNFVNQAYNPFTLVDENIALESHTGTLPYITSIISNSKKIASFGHTLNPGEAQATKPYSTESLTLYQENTSTKIVYNIASHEGLFDSTIVNSLKGKNLDAILINKTNFSNTTDLQDTIKLLKDTLQNTLIITSQDGEGDNTIPWVPTISRTFFKSSAEASAATISKTQALLSLGFDGAILATSANTDTYLPSIINSSDNHFLMFIRFNKEIPSTPISIVVSKQEDVKKLDDAKYTGKIYLLTEF